MLDTPLISLTIMQSLHKLNVHLSKVAKHYTTAVVEIHLDWHIEVASYMKLSVYNIVLNAASAVQTTQLV